MKVNVHAALALAQLARLSAAPVAGRALDKAVVEQRPRGVAVVVLARVLSQAPRAGDDLGHALRLCHWRRVIRETPALPAITIAKRSLFDATVLSFGFSLPSSLFSQRTFHLLQADRTVAPVSA